MSAGSMRYPKKLFFVGDTVPDTARRGAAAGVEVVEVGVQQEEVVDNGEFKFHFLRWAEVIRVVEEKS